MIVSENENMETVCIGDPSDRIRWRPLGLVVKGWHEDFQREHLTAVSVSSSFPFSDCLGHSVCADGNRRRKNLSVPVVHRAKQGFECFYCTADCQFLLESFNAQAYLFAFFWLLILLFLVLWMILLFHKVDPLSAKLQIPYLLWLSFAAYLNLGVWYLNR